MKKWIILGIILFFVLNGESESFYVAKSGSDSNPGSREAPWLTIQFAVDHMAPGDTVWVYGGVYNELVTFNQSGSASGGYLTLLAVPGESVVLDGSGLVNQGGWIPALIKIINRSYIRVEGLELRNLVSASASLFPAGIWIRGTSHHIELKNNRIHHIEQHNAEAGAHGIAVYGTSAVAPVHDILIHGNEVDSCQLGWSESLVLNGNVTDFVVCHNVVHDNNNIAFDFIGFEGECPDPAQDQARNGWVYENVAYNIDSRSNPSYGGEASADGFYVDGGRDILFERNTAYRCNIGFELASEHSGRSTSGIIMRNNFIYHNSVVGIAVGGYDRNRGSTDSCTIVNNTLYRNNSDQFGWGAEILVQYYCNNVVFKNNLIETAAGNRLVDNSTATGTNLTFDYNLYYSSGTPVWYWNGRTYTAFSAYRSGSGQEAHSLYNPPGLAHPEEGTPALTAESPAIDRGETLGSELLGTLDYEGNPRVVNGVVDIGASEFQGTSTELSDPLSLKIPTRMRLVGNYPNPFNPTTRIVFELAATAAVRLEVYNSLGEKVRVLVNERLSAGRHQIEWDGRDDAGLICSSGVYFVVLNRRQAHPLKILLLR